MYGELSNFSMNTVTPTAMEKGLGVLLATASETKPRMLLGASAYSVTNTTNTTPVLAMCPSTDLTTYSGVQTIDTNQKNVVYILNSSQVFSSLSTTYNPSCLVPYNETRAGGGTFPIIPPGWMLFGVYGDLDADGAISWQVCTCDLG